MKQPLRRLLIRYRSGSLPLRDLLKELEDLPYLDLAFAKLDLHRGLRRRFPEAIFAQGKTPEQVAAIAQTLHEKGYPVIATRVSPAMAGQVRRRLPWARYFPKAGILAGPTGGRKSLSGQGRKAVVVTAGTSDGPVAEEAAVTLELSGCRVQRLFDVGVAGLHRILAHRKLLREAGVIVVAAGMDGVLPSVVSGLVGCPVIAVPTSVGYGASFKGMAALLTMLNSCSPGVGVVNIDNGFGAGCLAVLILNPR